MNSTDLESIARNREPHDEQNGVKAYLSPNAPEKASVWMSEYIVKHVDGASPDDFRAVTVLLQDEECVVSAPFIISAHTDLSTDFQISASFLAWLLDQKRPDGESKEIQRTLRVAAYALQLLQRFNSGGYDDTSVDLGDFTDEEIRGVAQTIIDAGAADPYVQFDQSGVTTREAVPGWAIEEGERFSNPFTIGGRTFIAVSGPGYTAAIENARSGNFQDCKSRDIGCAVVHEVPDDATVNFGYAQK
ncbi:hypothetical protein [Salinibacter ruber]|uniref:hypothetical protein n=1 Tax=Salinibacter ruber TaxID=146919 RepID=UPI002169DF47|nr:hypothetical protein [Salinibacter ruber]MCS3822682.1 hypothetical protein [Salinibacter ruber]